ncbi:MAG: DUF4926 domain-containing protein [Anaerolineales bacterium]|nr:DUF4926 domain-containing protein [Anaerolineales bacterium]MCB8950828.1 DUF4926 domain-containing protein [Ardenticatenales bacterium]
MIKPAQYDVVEMLQPVLGANLPAGSQGTIVHQYDEEEFEIEFVDEWGETVTLVRLNRQHFLVIWRAEGEESVSVADQVAQLVDRLPENAGTQILNFAHYLSWRTQGLPQTHPV